jgi:hypothetical protein
LLSLSVLVNFSDYCEVSRSAFIRGPIDTSLLLHNQRSFERKL